MDFPDPSMPVKVMSFMLRADSVKGGAARCRILREFDDVIDDFHNRDDVNT